MASKKLFIKHGTGQLNIYNIIDQHICKFTTTRLGPSVNFLPQGPCHVQISNKFIASMNYFFSNIWPGSWCWEITYDLAVIFEFTNGLVRDVGNKDMVWSVMFEIYTWPDPKCWKFTHGLVRDVRNVYVAWSVNKEI